MKSWIQKINQLSEKRERTILGLMSGTSMDGIDAAVCRIRGSSFETQLDVLDYETLEVGDALKKKFQKLAYKEKSHLGDILRFEAELTAEWNRLISAVTETKKESFSGIDLVASHGQTILHTPDRENQRHNTLQIVDGDWLARQTGIPVISDFRRKHIAAGYEGAPLAPLAEILLFSDPDENRILLNLGGIANFTFLKAGISEPVLPFATDTGPANTLLDETVKRLLPGRSYDNDGAIARSGSVDEKLLKEFLEHPFFAEEYPKSTGQEDFHWEWVFRSLTKSKIDPEVNDLLATLVELTAKTVGDAIRFKTDWVPCKVFVSGGGWQNSFLKERLQHHMPGYTLLSSSELGMDPGAKEAALFAVLANETVAGQGWIKPGGSKFTLGKISLP